MSSANLSNRKKEPGGQEGGGEDEIRAVGHGKITKALSAVVTCLDYKSTEGRDTKYPGTK